MLLLETDARRLPRATRLRQHSSMHGTQFLALLAPNAQPLSGLASITASARGSQPRLLPQLHQVQPRRESRLAAISTQRQSLVTSVPSLLLATTSQPLSSTLGTAYLEQMERTALVPCGRTSTTVLVSPDHHPQQQPRLQSRLLLLKSQPLARPKLASSRAAPSLPRLRPE